MPFNKQSRNKLWQFSSTTKEIKKANSYEEVSLVKAFIKKQATSTAKRILNTPNEETGKNNPLNQCEQLGYFYLKQNGNIIAAIRTMFFYKQQIPQTIKTKYDFDDPIVTLNNILEIDSLVIVESENTKTIISAMMYRALQFFAQKKYNIDLICCSALPRYVNYLKSFGMRRRSTCHHHYSNENLRVNLIASPKLVNTAKLNFIQRFYIKPLMKTFSHKMLKSTQTRLDFFFKSLPYQDEIKYFTQVDFDLLKAGIDDDFHRIFLDNLEFDAFKRCFGIFLEVENGKPIFSLNDGMPELLFILSGQLVIESDGKILAHINPGELMADPALFKQINSDKLILRASKNTKLLSLEKSLISDYIKQLEKNKEPIKQYFHRLGKRLTQSLPLHAKATVLEQQKDDRPSHYLDS